MLSYMVWAHITYVYVHMNAALLTIIDGNIMIKLSHDLINLFLYYHE